MDTSYEDRIRQLAYQLWDADGRPEGGSETYWHRAESRFRQTETGHDKVVEDSFPASDPPSNTGVTGPRSHKA